MCSTCKPSACVWTCRSWLLPLTSFDLHFVLPCFMWSLQVSLEEYLADPDKYITQVPTQSELPAPEPKPERPYEAPSSGSSSSSKRSSSGGKSGGLGPGEIAGAVVGATAGVGILGALAYFVGYKKLYKSRQATSYKRGQIPDGPSECC